MIEPRAIHAVETADYWYQKVIEECKHNAYYGFPAVEHKTYRTYLKNYDFYYYRAADICSRYGYEIITIKTSICSDNYKLDVRRLKEDI